MFITEFLLNKEGAIPKYIKYILKEDLDKLLSLSSTDLQEKINVTIIEHLSESLQSSCILYSKIDKEKYHLQLGTYNGAVDFVVKSNNNVIDYLNLVPSPPPDTEFKKNIFYEESFSELKFTGTPDGKICSPAETQPQALLFLLSGSGPQDMDYRIGQNAIFKEIAHGLSKFGISTVRFNKRFYKKVDLLDYSSVNLKNEIIDDAINIIKLATSNNKYKNIPVFIAGHSLGAYLTPLISYQATRRITVNPVGLILLSMPFRRINVLLKEQLSKLDNLNPHIKKQHPLLLNDIGRKYFKELNNNHPLKYIKQMNEVPIFIAQGDHDIQVDIEKDFTRWELELTNRINVKFQSYKDINHILTTTNPEYNDVEQYLQKGEVSKELIEDIGNWILQNAHNSFVK
ncbi:hypothetical protein CC014_18225 [Salmonella enterica]|nr:hypothetical protein [Salmonella enterica]EAT1014605.1 hypothetical protein [Salmonella enterica]EBB2055421.1 hypothetical protein [Salmonella enterica]EBN0646549.1 hypothetical protein [Salmonella enterica]EFO5648740.1 hypothetical protein [Salmonella enterica subsp. enterica serovar Miami]